MVVYMNFYNSSVINREFTALENLVKQFPVNNSLAQKKLIVGQIEILKSLISENTAAFAALVSFEKKVELLDPRRLGVDYNKLRDSLPKIYETIIPLLRIRESLGLPRDSGNLPLDRPKGLKDPALAARFKDRALGREVESRDLDVGDIELVSSMVEEEEKKLSSERPPAAELSELVAKRNLKRDMGQQAVARKNIKREIDEKEVGELRRNLTSSNARATLDNIKAYGRDVDTLQARLDCMRLDSSIETWEALTCIPTNILKAVKDQGLKNKNLDAFKKMLCVKGAWIPEIEGMHLKIMHNMLTRLGHVMREPGQIAAESEIAAEIETKIESEMRAAKREVAGFQKTMKKLKTNLLKGADREKPAKRMLTLARGAPAVGKTAFLAGQFALACDDIKVLILNNLKGLTPQQTHFESTAIVELFRTSAEEHFGQGLTNDALFIQDDVILAKIADAKKGNQQIRMTDIQVDFKTICCRILKRSPYEPRMNFDILSKSFRASIENRAKALAMVKGNPDVFKEFTLTVWNGRGYDVVAYLDQATGKLVVNNPKEFEKIVDADSAKIQAEIEEVGNTIITEDFIKEFTAGMPEETRKEFSAALGKHLGKPFSVALDEHSKAPITRLSVAAEVMKQAETPFTASS